MGNGESERVGCGEDAETAFFLLLEQIRNFRRIPIHQKGSPERNVLALGERNKIMLRSDVIIIELMTMTYIFGRTVHIYLANTNETLVRGKMGGKEMSGYTITFHCGTSANQSHNRRDPQSVIRANERDRENGLNCHIKENGHHETFVDMSPSEGCQRILGEAVRNYNEKQKRKDRKTTVKKEVEKYQQKDHASLVREVVLEIGNKNSYPDEDECRRVLYKQFKAFQKENPNLQIIGAYFHADEPDSAPHMHIDFIPFHNKRTRGLDVQLGMTGALEDMGYKNIGFNRKQDREGGALKEWTEDMRNLMHEVANDYGIETVKGTDQGKTHERTDIHKTMELQYEIERLRNELEELQTINMDIEERIEKNQGTLEESRDKIHEMSKQIELLNSEGKQLVEDLNKKDRELQFKSEINPAFKDFSEKVLERGWKNSWNLDIEKGWEIEF